MSTLTDEQVVRRLAKRDPEHGDEALAELRFSELAVKEAIGEITQQELAELERLDLERSIDSPNYLTSLDALQPVLKGLTDEEWHHLHNILGKQQGNQPFWGSKVTKWMFTLPPNQLAHAIAEVVGPDAGALDKLHRLE